MIANLQDFILETRLFNTLQVEDLLLVEYKCLVQKDQSHIWTHHNYFAYVTGGQKKWKTKEGEYLVSSGEALFVKKGGSEVYQYFEEPFYVLFIFLSDHLIREVLQKHHRQKKKDVTADIPITQVLPLRLNPVLDQFFRSMLTFFKQSVAPHPSLLKLKIEELILNILLQPENPEIRQYFLDLGRRQKSDLVEIMQNHYHYPLSISDYARLCARSLSSFRRDFKKHFLTTPGKWLIKERLTHSCFLLRNTNKTLTEVIEESGFKNRSHFMRAFKDTYACTPIQYRVQHTTN